MTDSDRQERIRQTLGWITPQLQAIEDMQARVVADLSAIIDEETRTLREERDAALAAVEENRRNYETSLAQAYASCRNMEGRIRNVVAGRDAALAEAARNGETIKRAWGEGYNAGWFDRNRVSEGSLHPDNVILNPYRDDSESVHFAPWGTYYASCGWRLPDGDRDEQPVTDERRKTTCPTCRSYFRNPSDAAETSEEPCGLCGRVDCPWPREAFSVPAPVSEADAPDYEALHDALPAEAHSCGIWDYLDPKGCYLATACAGTFADGTECRTRRDEHADQPFPSAIPSLDITDHVFVEPEADAAGGEGE